MDDGVLGAVIAGGRSTRYGSPKALVRVGGARIVDRVIAAMREVIAEPVLIANDPELAAAVGLAWRSDEVADLGALGGIHTALVWAMERGCRGAVAVACDMPFLSSGLLRHMIETSARADQPEVVIPESGGRRGVEPLCAYYSVTALDAMKRSIAAGDHRMIGFHPDVRVARIPIDEVEKFGDPRELFLNVNTPQDREIADRISVKGVG